jgi:hypothetical protein
VLWWVWVCALFDSEHITDLSKRCFFVDCDVCMLIWHVIACLFGGRVIYPHWNLLLIYTYKKEITYK